MPIKTLDKRYSGSSMPFYTIGSMRSLAIPLLAALFGTYCIAKTMVFWQSGFPTLDSQPVKQATLEKALSVPEESFVGLSGLERPQALADTDLLVMPYGSAFPTEAWRAISNYLHRGGNLLVIGGQPFRVPVTNSGSDYRPHRRRRLFTRARHRTYLRSSTARCGDLRLEAWIFVSASHRSTGAEILCPAGPRHCRSRLHARSHGRENRRADGGEQSYSRGQWRDVGRLEPR